MNVDICFVTWPNHPKRMVYLRRVWDSILTNISTPRHTVRWLCSSESERDPACSWHGDQLEEFCKSRGIELHWRGTPASLGAGMNSAIAICRSPVFAIWQDDYALEHPFNLSDAVDFMLRRRNVDLFRIEYFTDPKTGTQFLAKEIEPGFRQVDIDGTWPYGDGPFLIRQDFVPKWGRYVEGGQHGMSESTMLWKLVRYRATIAAGDRSHCGHIGGVASVPESQEYRSRAIKRSDAI